MSDQKAWASPPRLEQPPRQGLRAAPFQGMFHDRAKKTPGRISSERAATPRRVRTRALIRRYRLAQTVPTPRTINRHAFRNRLDRPWIHSTLREPIAVRDHPPHGDGRKPDTPQQPAN